MKIWLDDWREAPEGWIHTKTVAESFGQTKEACKDDLPFLDYCIEPINGPKL